MQYGLYILCLIFASGFSAFPQEGDDSYFSVVLLPDTQFYAETYHDEFYGQTQWIKENIETENIKMVIHLGDIVQNRNESKEEWEVAKKAFSTIDGLVPYTVAPGNHDQDLTPIFADAQTIRIRPRFSPDVIAVMG